MQAHSLLHKTAKDLRRLQARKLRNYIETQIYPFHPYYRKLFDRNKIKPGHIRSVRDLGIIPLTSKEDFFSGDQDAEKALKFVLNPSRENILKFWPLNKRIMLRLKNMMSRRDYVRRSMESEYNPIFLTATTGTTRDPVSFLYTHHDVQNLYEAGARIVEVTQVKSKERGVNVFPYAPHLAFWQTFFAGISRNMFILSTGGGKTIGTQGNISVLRKVNPTWMIGTPSYVYHTLKAASEQGERLDSVKKVILGAARVPSGFKIKLMGILESMGSGEVQMMGTYGFTEAKMAWAECPAQNDRSSGYHIYPDKEIFEIIDPDTDEVLPEGADGELLHTSLDARGTCVIRYRTRDFVRGGIQYSPCPYCGCTVPRISSDISRVTSIKSLSFTKIKSTLINFDNLEHVIRGLEEIDEYLIEIGKKDDDPYEVEEIKLYVNLAHKVHDLNKLKVKINNKTRDATEIAFNSITVLSRKEMYTRLDIEKAIKIKRVVDNRAGIIEKHEKKDQ